MFSSQNSQVSSAANYIEDVFSTYLYTGNSSTQTITNGIDLAGDGGLVWLKGRSLGYNNGLFDTIRGADYLLCSNNTDPSTSISGIPANAWITGFNSDGFGLGSNGSANASGQTYASWTFRKQPKFFDVVTYTGTGSVQNIAHNLGSVPGCIIVKRTDTTSNWVVYHRSLNTTSGGLIALNLTSGELTDVNAFNSTVPTSTVFTVGSASSTNGSGGTFVAYVFAHNAGGFGLTGTDNVISCGSVTLNSSGAGTVNLGYEPQWVLMKTSSSANDWIIFDTMRGFSVTGGSGYNTLNPNLSAAEFSGSSTYFQLTNTGFSINMNFAGWQNENLIYIAIRRGPMKVPTSGTSVFSPVLRNGTGANANIQSGFPTDLIVFLNTNRDWDAMGNYWTDRMRSGLKYLTSTATNAEADWNNAFQNNNGFDTQNGVLVTSDVANGVINHSGTPYINWMFRRAPSFFDEVCYTGNGVNGLQVTHNLGVAPELIIIKSRGNANWQVSYSSNSYDGRLYLNTTDALLNSGLDPVPASGTASYITVRAVSTANSNNVNYVAYLFATCAGVSKVGSYTGTGTTKQVDCGFTGGARFVLIKRTDSTGDWYVWDTARGIVSGNDPYLLLNSTAAETTGTDYIDTYSAGFEISSTAPAAINANGGTFIFLAIA